MDSPIVRNVLDSFNTIPLADIQLLLSINNIPISEGNIYNTARNLLLTGNLRSVPATSLADWIIAYRVANTNTVPQFHISAILQASSQELRTLAQSLSLNNINSFSKERMFRILRFLGVLNDDIILLEYLPDDLLLKTLNYYPTCNIHLACEIDPFRRLCQKNSFLNFMRIRVGNDTRFNTSEFTRDQLDRLCKTKLHDKIVAAYAKSFVIDRSDHVYPFGRNDNGQLGLGDNDTRYLIRTIPDLDNIISIASGGYHTLMLDSFGRVYAFGSNSEGQLGLNDNITRPIPVLIPNISNIVSIACGSGCSLLLTDDGQVYSMGAINISLLQNGEETNKVPTLIPELNNIISISCTSIHALFLTKDGQVFGYGYNKLGQLGLNGDNILIPTLIPGLTDIVQISAGGFHSLALNSRGQVYGFGSNEYGQVGSNTLWRRASFDAELQNIRHLILIEDLTDIISISAGGYHSLVLNSIGQVYSFGNNRSGQLGLGIVNSQFSPTLIPTVSNVTSISAGYDHSLLVSNNQFYGFGENTFNQVGISSSNGVKIYTPTLIPIPI